MHADFIGCYWKYICCEVLYICIRYKKLNHRQLYICLFIRTCIQNLYLITLIHREVKSHIEVRRELLSDAFHCTRQQDTSVVFSQPAECPPHQVAICQVSQKSAMRHNWDYYKTMLCFGRCSTVEMYILLKIIHILRLPDWRYQLIYQGWWPANIIVRYLNYITVTS